MSTRGEIQEGILQLPTDQRQALAWWFASESATALNMTEEAALLRRGSTMADLDAGRGVPSAQKRCLLFELDH
jgi:hypothetical protein